MLSFARVTRGLSNAAAFPTRPLTRPDLTAIPFWTRRNSSSYNKEDFLREALGEEMDSHPADSGQHVSKPASGDNSERPDTRDITTIPLENSHKSPAASHDLSSHSFFSQQLQVENKSPEEHADAENAYKAPPKAPPLAYQVQIQPSNDRLDPNNRLLNKLVGDLAPDDLSRLPPQNRLLARGSVGAVGENRTPAKKPSPLNPLVRLQMTSVPRVVTFYSLRADTTIADVLLSIREAAVAGMVGPDDTRILNARIRPAEGPSPTTMVARVEFANRHGARKIQELAQAKRLRIRGVIGHTALSRSRGEPKQPLRPAPIGATTVDDSIGVHTPDARVYLDHAKLKDKLVRRTHLQYNRELWEAVHNGGQL